MIQLRVNPGLVSVFYFLFLDKTLLTLLDYALARTLSSAYNAQIAAGRPLRLRSVDVLGVTTGLLGARTSIANLTALAAKVALLAVIITLEWNIGSEFRRTSAPAFRHGTFDLDPSEAALNTTSVTLRRVQRLWDNTRTCRTTGPTDAVTFYHVVYNLSGGVIIDDELLTDDELQALGVSDCRFLPVNRESVTCMSPDFVAAADVRPLVRVRGCSPYARDTGLPCFAENRVRRSMGALNFDDFGSQRIFTVSSLHRYSYILTPFSRADVRSILPELDVDGSTVSLDMLCITAEYRLDANSPVNAVTKCLTTLVTADDATVFDWWRYDPGTHELESVFAGPVFDTALDVGTFIKASYAYNLQTRSSDYVTVAGIIVAEAMVFTVANATPAILARRSFQVTLIPGFCGALIGALVGLTTLATTSPPSPSAIARPSTSTHTLPTRGRKRRSLPPPHESASSGSYSSTT